MIDPVLPGHFGPDMTFFNSVRLTALAAMFVLASPALSRAETTDAESSDPYVYIISPTDGTVFPEVPSTIAIEFGVESVFSIELFVDGEYRDVVDGCGFDCGFYGVELDEGMHELRILGDGAVDDTVIVFVGEGPGDTGETSSGDTGDGDTSTSGEGDSGSTGNVDSGDGESGEDGDTGDGYDEADDGTGGEVDDMSGRGCEIASSASPLGLLALPALLLLPAIRRRRD